MMPPVPRSTLFPYTNALPISSLVTSAPALPMATPIDAAFTAGASFTPSRSEEHTSELQSRQYLVCRLLLEKKKQRNNAAPAGHDSDPPPPAAPSIDGQGRRTM